MKNLKSILFLILAILAAACSKDLVTQPDKTSENSSLKYAKPHLKIAIMSDIHYLDPSLMTNNAAVGTAFQTYLNSDPKLIEFSAPIFMEAISEVLAAKPDILLIPGDLTKDGEQVSHMAVQSFLKEISDKGIKVFVVPGNHDINNPEAVSYNGNNATMVNSISKDDFATIYADFGYKDAKYKDNNSLSYIAQPFNNLWILGIDDCKYYDNVPGSPAIVSGVIKAETMSWILDRLAEAKKKNIKVYAMMHHGIMEHYTGQETLDPGYVTDSWETKADQLIDAGLGVMFTGHYHANDITMRTKDQKTLFDIETGSLVTPPSPFRIITVDTNYMTIDTKHITSIQGMPGPAFVTYSAAFVSAHLDGIFTYMLINRYGVPPANAAGLAPLFTHAFMAHCAGDEQMLPADQPYIQGLLADQTTAPLGYALLALWTDLSPADNQLTIEMKKRLK